MKLHETIECLKAENLQLCEELKLVVKPGNKHFLR